MSNWVVPDYFVVSREGIYVVECKSPLAFCKVPAGANPQFTRDAAGWPRLGQSRTLDFRRFHTRALREQRAGEFAFIPGTHGRMGSEDRQTL